jgi:hypothetical protein
MAFNSTTSVSVSVTAGDRNQDATRPDNIPKAPTPVAIRKIATTRPSDVIGYRSPYETQRDKLREELTLAELAAHDARIEVLHVEGILGLPTAAISHRSRFSIP